MTYTADATQQLHAALAMAGPVRGVVRDGVARVQAWSAAYAAGQEASGANPDTAREHAQKASADLLRLPLADLTYTERLLVCRALRVADTTRKAS